MVLASQIAWSESCENALQTISSSSNQNDLEPVLKVLRVVEATLNILADSVLQEQPPVRRRKLEHLVSKLLLIGYIFFCFFFAVPKTLCFSFRWKLELLLGSATYVQPYGYSFSLPKVTQVKIQENVLIIFCKMRKHKILPCESAAKEFSFEW